MGKYVLYGGRHTRSPLVEQVLAECGAPYETREIDMARQEHRDPAYLAINPAGWIPALVTPEGETLTETPAINLRLAERHGATHLAPAPDDPERGLFLCRLFYLTGMLEPALKRYWYPHRYADGAADAPAVEAKAQEEAVGCFAFLDGRLAERGPFHLGPRFSLVDLMTAYWSESFEDPATLREFDALRRCRERVYERPALKPFAHSMRRMVEAFRGGAGA